MNPVHTPKHSFSEVNLNGILSSAPSRGELFLSFRLQTKILYVFLISLMHATFQDHLIFLGLFTFVAFGESRNCGDILRNLQHKDGKKVV
jgi:hypothetical protein